MLTPTFNRLKFRAFTMMVAFVCLVTVSTAQLAGCNTATVTGEKQATGTATRAPTGTAGPLSVTTDNGSVEVQGRSDATEIKVLATFRARTQERLDAAKVVIIANPAGGASISVEWPDGERQSNEGCSMVIVVPDAVGVSIDTNNGRITIDGLAGTATLKSSNGAITVKDHQGDVNAQTSNGRIEAHGVTGSLDLDTRNGAISITEALSTVKAVTNNGRINVKLAGEQSGSVTLKSSNGGIDFEPGPLFVGALSARTSNGGVKLNDATGKVQTKSSVKSSATYIFGAAATNAAVTAASAAPATDAIATPAPAAATPAGAAPASIIETSNASITITVK